MGIARLVTLNSLSLNHNSSDAELVYIVDLYIFYFSKPEYGSV